MFISYLLCHDTTDLHALSFPVVLRLVHRWFWRKVWEPLLLLRELEVKIVLVDGRRHGTTSASRTSAEHEVGSKLGAPGGTVVIALFLLGSKSGKAGGHKALRLRASLMSGLLLLLLLVEVLLNFTIFVGCMARAIFGILYHSP